MATLGLDDIRRHFKLTATSWAISECASFNQFTRPTFRNMFKPLNKNASLITNFDRRGIREELERLGRLDEKPQKRNGWTKGCGKDNGPLDIPQ